MTKKLSALNESMIDEIFRSLDVGAETVRDYRSRIDMFLRFVDDKGVGYDTFVEFKRSLGARDDFSVSTKNKYLVSTKAFLKQLHRRGVLTVDITTGVKSFREGREHRVIGVDMADFEAIRKAQVRSGTARSYRLYSILALCALNGLRQVEIVRLDFSDVNLGEGTALVLGKGESVKRLVYLAPEAIEALRKYLEATGIKDGALFRSFSDRPSERLTTQTINREIKALFEMANVDKTVHGLRHFYATHLLKSGHDIRDVRKFCRHKSIDTTLLYDDEVDLKEKAQKVFACLPKIGLDSMTTLQQYRSYSVDDSAGGRGGELAEIGSRAGKACAINEALVVAGIPA